MNEILPYLISSVVLSSARNITSKKTAANTKQNADFFLTQTLLFGFASALLLCAFIWNFSMPSFETIIHGIIYGILLLLSQWMLTIALKMGDTSVCTVIYSLGFILPTLSGSIFFDEDFTYLGGIGVVLAVVVVLLNIKRRDKTATARGGFLPFIIVAMLSSGGLGIMQKLQQLVNEPEKKCAFLLVGFVFAFCVSLIALLVCHKKPKFTFDKIFYSAITGVSFGGANLFNTILAGKMKSAVFFPLQNISTILLTTLLGIVFFKEKITKKTVLILVLGIVVILLFSV